MSRVSSWSYWDIFMSAYFNKIVGNTEVILTYAELK